MVKWSIAIARSKRNRIKGRLAPLQGKRHLVGGADRDAASPRQPSLVNTELARARVAHHPRASRGHFDLGDPQPPTYCVAGWAIERQACDGFAA